MTADLTIEVQKEKDGIACRVVLTTDRSEPLVVENAVTSSMNAADFEDARWYFEEFPLLQGETVTIRAAQVESRLRVKASELYASVVHDDHRISRIGARLADVSLLEQLHVRIVEAPGCPWVPWEMMTGPLLTPLSHSVASFTRTVRMDAEPADDVTNISDNSKVAAPHHDDVRVLLITARPHATDTTDDAPFRSIARHVALAAADPSSGIAVDLLRPPTFGEMARVLAEAQAAGRPYDIVHFDGHGDFRASTFQPNRKKGYLCFERANNEGTDFVEGRRFGAELAARGVRIAVLNACRSAYVEPTDGAAMESLASEVARCGIAGVVAMGFKVSIACAAKLVSMIYAGLASGSTLGESVGTARRTITDRPKVRDLLWPGILDAAIPVVYEREPLRLRARGRRTVSLDVAPGRATPATEALHIIGDEEESWSDQVPFVGHDETILDIERAFRGSPTVALFGIAGAGKSALAAEYARWFTLTNSESAAVVTNVERFSTFESLATKLADYPEALWILENSDSVPWRDELAAHIETRDARPTLLTGRAPSQYASATAIPVLGLGHEDRWFLARSALGEIADAPGFAAVLDWTQGVPGVVLSVPELINVSALESYEATHAALQKLRGGEAVPDAVLARMNLRPFTPEEMRSIPSSIVMYLFQGFTSWTDWNTLAMIMKNRGVDFGIDNPNELAKILIPASRIGLACRMRETWFQLHPLAPSITMKPFIDLVGSMGGAEPAGRRRAVGITYSCFLQAITLGVRMGKTIRENAGGFASIRRQLQNLWHLVECGADGGDAATLALTPLSSLRDYLEENGRVDEWVSLFHRFLDGIKRNIPDAAASPENLGILLNQFLEHEARRDGNTAVIEALRADTARRARTEAITVTPLEPDAPTIDVSHNILVSTLIKEGEALTSRQSPQAIEVLTRACELAGGDVVRLANAQIALARAYFNIASVRDLAKYEEFARKALDTAPAMFPDLVLRAKYSLGNAISLRVGDEKESPERLARMREATAMLESIVHSQDADSHMIGNAQNALANIARAKGDMKGASEYLLQAISAFESGKHHAEHSMALANAARAFLARGNPTMALTYAGLALESGHLSAAHERSVQQMIANLENNA